MESREFAEKIVELMLDKKAYQVKLLDIKEVSGIADYFVICSGASDTQVRAIADNVDRDLAKGGIKCYHKEGFDSLNWVLLDYFDVVVHVFKEDAREYYNLEKLYRDAPSYDVDDEGNITKAE